MDVINGQISGRRGIKTGAKHKIVDLHMEYPDMSEGQIAKLAHCDKANVHRILKKFRENQLPNEDIGKFLDGRVNSIRSVQARILGSFTDEEIQKTPFSQRVIALGILIDKERLETGQSTQNVAVLLDLVEYAKAMRDGRMPALPSDVQADNRGDKTK